MDHFTAHHHEAEYFKVWGTNIDTEMDVDFLKPENYVPLWKWLIDVARAEDARDRAQAQLTADATDLNRPRAEAALARAQNRIKVASSV